MQTPSYGQAVQVNAIATEQTGPLPADPKQASNQANTLLNIGIQDQKDFPGDILQELYTELTVFDGRVLFECPALVKPTGIDLFNCPLTIVLKLRVRRRTARGTVVLWHVVLPLPTISKYLVNMPHKWETWLGLFPHTEVLEAHPPDAMFTQAVHLISRKEFPKLRLLFTYHNAELQAQTFAQREMQEQESRRRAELSQQVGRQQFEEIHKLTRTLRDSSESTPPGVERSPSQQSPVAERLSVSSFAQVQDKERSIRAGLQSALRLIADVRQMLASESPTGHRPMAIPEPLEDDFVLASPLPGQLVEAHCDQLRQCLFNVSGGLGSPSNTAAILTDSLRRSLLGLVKESQGRGDVPGTLADLSSVGSGERDPLAFVRERYPDLWEAYREVAKVAKDRAMLLEERSRQQAPGEADRQLEAVLVQRQALQYSYENEVASLRRELAMKDEELGRLRAQLGAAS